MAKIIGNTTATPNPRPDWNQVDETKADYIKNKPQLGALATKDEITADDVKAVSFEAQTLTEEQKAQVRENIGAGESGFSGSYDDLTNKPEIPTMLVRNGTLVISTLLL